MKLIFRILLTMSLIPAILSASEPLKVGDTAPTVTVTTHTGEKLELSAVYAAGPVLIYFYPKADTPGCTKQACNLRDHFESVQKSGITILGVSRDAVKEQAEFREKYTLPFTLIADHEGQLGNVFGVGGMLGFYKRQSFLIAGGKVIWRDLSATPATQAQDALSALQQWKASNQK